jgi:hypothetical protein
MFYPAKIAGGVFTGFRNYSAGGLKPPLRKKSLQDVLFDSDARPESRKK